MSTYSRRRLLTSLGLSLVPAFTVLVPSAASAASDTSPPTKPKNLRVEGVSFTWVTLVWDPSTDNSGVITYEATVDTPDGLRTAQTVGTSQGFGGLGAGVTYTAAVAAVDLAGNRSPSVSISFTTLPRTGPPPTAPSNLRAVYVGGVLHSIAWDASVHSSPVSYWLRSGPNVVFSTSRTSVSVFELVHIACVDPGSTHTFTVQAMGADNYPSTHSAPLSVTLPQTVSN